MFSDNNENSRENTRPKMPKIDIDLDPFRLLGSLFSSKSNSSVKSSCENCNAKFGLMKSKKICQSCKFEFCVNCFKSETDFGRSTICLKCRVFSKRPLKREDLIKLKVKELKWFLRSRRISSNLCKEKSDLVDLIIQHFGLRITSQSNQAGPSRRSFDDASASNRRNDSATNLKSTTQTTIDNQTSQPSSESTPESEWEFVNERFSSMNSSNGNSNSDSQQNSNHSSNPNSHNQTPDARTPTNEAIVNNLTDENQNGSNGGDINFTILDDNVSSSSNQNLNPQMMSDDSATDAANRNSRLEADSLDDTRRTASASRLSNSNLNYLNKTTNLSESTESLTSFKNFNIGDVKSEGEIKSLSVRQLKLVLTRNYVNYKGCCEKEELQEKAIRLWNQIRQDNDLIDGTRDEDLCKICMERVINCVLLECGHLVTCLDCGKRLNECPVCRQFVVRALRTFKS